MMFITCYNYSLKSDDVYRPIICTIDLGQFDHDLTLRRHYPKLVNHFV